MIQIKEVQDKIKKSKLPENIKAAVLKFLPNCRENVLAFIFSEAQKIGFEFFGETLVSLLQLFYSAESKIRKGDFSEVINIVKTAPENPVWANGEYILPWVLDIEKLISDNAESEDQELISSIKIFKVRMFEFLPVVEVAELLKGYAVSLVIEDTNLQFLLKKYIYLRHWEGDSLIIKPLINALVSNQEILSTDQVEVAGKRVPATLSNILKNFNQTSSVTRGAKTNLDVTKYVVSFKNISPKNKEALLTLLTIYLWMGKPEVSREEIYREDDIKSFSSEEDMVNAPIGFYDFDTQSPFEFSFAPQVPAPKNAPQVVPMEEVSSSPVAVMPPLTLKKQGPVQGYMAGAKSTNIQDLLKSSSQDYESRGLRMGNGSSPSSLIVNPLPVDAGIKKQNNKEQEINKKLEELKKKTKGIN